MAGPDPAIFTSTVRREMAGSSPAMTLWQRCDLIGTRSNRRNAVLLVMAGVPPYARRQIRRLGPIMTVMGRTAQPAAHDLARPVHRSRRRMTRMRRHRTRAAGYVRAPGAVAINAAHA
jgi:hypothetical protein